MTIPMNSNFTKLKAVLAKGSNDFDEALPFLADLLSIPASLPSDLTPQRRKQKTLFAQLAHLEGLAARQPVLMLFEDVHWSDPTTREWLQLIVDRITNLRVLLIITFRPEFVSPWVGRSQVTLLSLSRLAPRQRSEMVARVVEGKTLPREISDQIIDRTDGIPLFIEELTKAVVESGVLTKTADGYAVKGPVTSLAIPRTLHASLLARLDRLGSAREVAQIGTALGRQFSHELISAVAQMPAEEVESALTQLTNAELMFRRGDPPDAEYTFKHVLVQDAAYEALLRSQRQVLHARIASTIEARFPEMVETRPELLAHHYLGGTSATGYQLLAASWRKSRQELRECGGGSALGQSFDAGSRSAGVQRIVYEWKYKSNRLSVFR